MIIIILMSNLNFILWASSDLFGKFLLPMKLGKQHDFGKILHDFRQIGKGYLLNLDFSANWESLRLPKPVIYSANNCWHFNIYEQDKF